MLIALTTLTLLGCGDADTQSRLDTLEADLQTAQATIDDQASLIEALRSRMATAETTVEDLGGDVDSLESVDDLHDQVLSALSTELEGLDTEVDGLLADMGDVEGDVSALQAQVASNTTVASGVEPLLDYLDVDTTDHAVAFVGANVYVQSGEGSTDATVNGLGNLVVGYDEDDGADDKTGSHNLIVGSSHSYTSSASILGGEDNETSDSFTVAFGYTNAASRGHAVVLGGRDNVATSNYSSILGGSGNEASGNAASIVGGIDNTTGDYAAVVVGGRENDASSQGSSILGGHSNNTSTAAYTTIYGGQSQTVADDYDYAP